MTHKVTLIPGDGIGPEVTNAAVRIVDASGVKIEWERFSAGSEAFAKYGEYIPKELTHSIESTGLGLKGPVTTPIGGGFSSINVALRKQFELYANFRPIRNLPSLPTRYPSVDLAICRENTEGQYPEITYGEYIIDNTCMQLVMNPYQYDVLVMENLYGDIISDLCAAFVGGLGFVPSANLGDRCAISEAVHGSAPDIAGKDIANPTAVIRSAQLMLRHLGEHAAADKIHDGLEKVYRTKDKTTRDVGGKAGTSEFTDSIIQFMESTTDVPSQAESSHA